ncbi:DNA/RNA non-specific endonuclease [Enterococcus innesii]|uniref:DNA/RNA non-specific endonuclease n=1 Tax=Enterococcus innesii TaxID=2839759 RepID=UPI002DB625D0|nr:DNA/RNA non-specific endonuclease [Enterococcus innesii]MEB5953097.1 DNA/RNA non-specific endonuclease [Enterococcus innesii]
MKHKSKFILAALLSLLGFTASFIDFSAIDIELPSFMDEVFYQESISAEELIDIPEFNGENVVVKVNQNRPDFTEEELSLSNGYWQKFSDLDYLNRVGKAEAMLHRELMPTEDRGDISNVYPTGWNQKKLADGQWLYNRSHSIGHQMTGEDANWKNLFTGTQQLNQIYMVQYENEVANYLRQTNNHVRYRVTPLFRDQELLPRAVQMEAQSIEDDEIAFNIIIHNVQDGVAINYQTGIATVK